MENIMGKAIEKEGALMLEYGQGVHRINMITKIIRSMNM